MLMIGIAGGTGSGKTTVAQALVEALGVSKVALISQDSYYKDQSTRPFEERVKQNYDHPDAFENELLFADLNKLRQGKQIQVPIYDFTQHCRTKQQELVLPRPIVVVEGMQILYEPSLRGIFDIKAFVDADSDVRILRRIIRDTTERGRTLDSVCEQYLTTVKPMHEAFVEPTKRYADIIIPEGGHNTVALSLLISRIKHYLYEVESIAQ